MLTLLGAHNEVAQFAVSQMYAMPGFILNFKYDRTNTKIEPLTGITDFQSTKK